LASYFDVATSTPSGFRFSNPGGHGLYGSTARREARRSGVTLFE
jgi:hypothetical protein